MLILNMLSILRMRLISPPYRDGVLRRKVINKTYLEGMPRENKTMLYSESHQLQIRVSNAEHFGSVQPGPDHGSPDFSRRKGLCKLRLHIEFRLGKRTALLHTR